MAAHTTTPNPALSMKILDANRLANMNGGGGGLGASAAVSTTAATDGGGGGGKSGGAVLLRGGWNIGNDDDVSERKNSSEADESSSAEDPGAPMTPGGGGKQAVVGRDDGGVVGGDVEGDGSGEPARAAFANHAEFLAGMISMAVGLGNVWRFPYLCQRNGGGAFLIPYVVLLVLEGMPLSLIEIGIGQNMGQGSIGVWKTIHPRLGGLGICSTVVSFLVGLYYNVVITWCLYYFFRSFTTELPWASCPLDVNGTAVEECAKSSETQYFWYREALDASESIGDFGGIKVWMLICLFLAWAIVFLTMRKGIQSSGKVLYITAVFPYVILAIFFFRAVTLKGAAAGLLHLLTPKLDRLADPQVWLDAATQVFYSMSLAFGGIIAYSSYLPRRNDCTKDAVLTSMINLVTSIFTVTVVFSILGFKATVTHEDCLVKFNETHPGVLPDLDILTEHMDKIHHGYDAADIQEAFKQCNLTAELENAAEGTGLAFIVFTQAILEFPGAPFWSVIFFLMLLALGFGSQFGTMQGVVTNVFDVFQGRVTDRKEVLMGVLCVFCFLFDLIFVTGAGEYWVFIFDRYASTGLILIGFVQVVALTYVYGWRRFIDDIHRYTGRRPGLYWTICWRFVSPTIIAVIFVASIILQAMNSADYSVWIREEAKAEKVPLPGWALFAGICLIMLSFLPLPIVFLAQIARRSSPHRAGATTVVGMARSVVHRVATTTSTQPMMNGIDGDDDDNDLEPNGPTVICVLQEDPDEDELVDTRYQGIR